jgi:hypothetical protein
MQGPLGRPEGTRRQCGECLCTSDGCLDKVSWPDHRFDESKFEGLLGPDGLGPGEQY